VALHSIMPVHEMMQRRYMKSCFFMWPISREVSV